MANETARKRALAATFALSLERKPRKGLRFGKSRSLRA
jgi:hypothetical protein